MDQISSPVCRLSIGPMETGEFFFYSPRGKYATLVETEPIQNRSGLENGLKSCFLSSVSPSSIRSSVLGWGGVGGPAQFRAQDTGGLVCKRREKMASARLCSRSEQSSPAPAPANQQQRPLRVHQGASSDPAPAVYKDPDSEQLFRTLPSAADKLVFYIPDAAAGAPGCFSNVRHEEKKKHKTKMAGRTLLLHGGEMKRGPLGQSGDQSEEQKGDVLSSASTDLASFWFVCIPASEAQNKNVSASERGRSQPSSLLNRSNLILLFFNTFSSHSEFIQPAAEAGKKERERERHQTHNRPANTVSPEAAGKRAACSADTQGSRPVGSRSGFVRRCQRRMLCVGKRGVLRKLQSRGEAFICSLSLSREDHLRASGLLPLRVQDRVQT